MADRCLLPIKFLDEFREWLVGKGFTILETCSNPYEVLRAQNGSKTVMVFKKLNAKEHLTVQGKDYALVRQFLGDRKKEIRK